MNIVNKIWYAIFPYLCSTHEGLYENVDYGCFDAYKQYIDIHYNNLCSRLSLFVYESGIDPYNRKADGESIINFALMNDLYDKDIETIYRLYVEKKVLLIENEYTNFIIMDK